jgi:hypothetical protein
MKIIIHRINTIEQLNQIPSKYGVEIDIRGYGEKLLLHHDPISLNKSYDELEDYLQNFNHAFIIFNLKEAGYEQRVIDLTKKYNIENYFLLDCEFPYLYKATRKDGFKKIALRFSEAEPIEMVESQMKDGVPLADWVWIDTNTELPLDDKIIQKLKPFKTCLVCPERWGRPQDIEKYKEKINSLNFNLNAVMTSLKYAERWEK